MSSHGIICTHCHSNIITIIDIIEAIAFLLLDLKGYLVVSFCNSFETVYKGFGANQWSGEAVSCTIPHNITNLCRGHWSFSRVRLLLQKEHNVEISKLQTIVYM